MVTLNFAPLLRSSLGLDRMPLLLPDAAAVGRHRR
jgi:hypothetical protein